MFDYCITVKNEAALLRTHLESLHQKENVDFPIHVIIVGKESEDQILSAIQGWNVIIHKIPNYPKKTFIKGVWQLGSPAAYESAYANDWAMKNDCGNNEWKILIHPDTIYAESVLGFVRQKMKVPKMGAIGGIALGLFAIKQEAYDECDMTFASLMAVRLFPCLGDPETLCLRNAGVDPRLVGEGQPRRLLGLDVAELLITDLVSRDWIYEIGQTSIAGKLAHPGHGSNY